MAEESRLGPGSQTLLVGASAVVVIAGLRAASTIVVPILVALFISIVSMPLLFWLRSRRVPTPLAVLTTILADVAVLAVLILLLSSSISELVRERSKYEARIQEVQERLEVWTDESRAWLEERGIDASSWFGLEEVELPPAENAEIPAATASSDPLESAPPTPRLTNAWWLNLFNLNALLDAANSTLRGVASVLSNTLIIVIITTFILLEAATFRRKLRRAFGDPSIEERFERVMTQLRRYLGMKTAISAATGLIIGIWVAILGVDFAPLWGLTAFALNYIPNLGSIIAALPTTALAFVQQGFGLAVLVAIGYLVVNIVVGNFIEPHLMGRRLGLSTLVVFLSLVFWGWLWGPVGMLLCVPLTMIVKIMLENSQEFRWLAVLLEGKSTRRKRIPRRA